MQYIPNGPDIPEGLLEAHEEGNNGDTLSQRWALRAKFRRVIIRGIKSWLTFQRFQKVLSVTWLQDKRTSSWSVISTMTVEDYLEIAESAYADKGGLKGQREPLKTTSAVQIRKRMLSDLSEGAVLPPIVIGVVLDQAEFNALVQKKSDSIRQDLSDKALSTLAIIDGMQRTTALLEAVEQDAKIKSMPLRVEWWISTKVQSLVYRMMVLNTAQVPWTMARQMSVVFGAMVAEIQEKIGDIANIMTPENPGRRTKPGEYSSDVLVELYLSFSSRKTKVDTKQEVSDKFARLDLIENVSNEDYQTTFYEVLRKMAEIDHEFGRLQNAGDGRFSKGKAVFGTHPARIGFIVAAGQLILGRAGVEPNSDRQKTKLGEFFAGVDRLTSRLKNMNEDSLRDFVRLTTLEEVLSARSGKVGEYERAVFFEAFKVMFEDYDTLENLDPCWRAYG